MTDRRSRPTAWVLAAAALAIGLPVGLAGPFTSNGTQPPLLYAPNPPGVCAGCHGGFDNGYNVRPYTTWAGSMMANAGRDPLFWAALDVANNDLPGIGEWCLRCHAPVGWLAGRAFPPIGTVDGCSLDGEIDALENDFEGLSCAMCHRMQVNPDPPAGQQPVYYENGQFWIDDAACPNGFEPCRRGPYDYAGGLPEPPHGWAYSDYHTGSDHCGNCHNVTSPVLTLIDSNGTNTGVPVPIERTYTEWLQSDFAIPGPNGRTCQNCHMPDAMHDPAYPSIASDINRTGDLPIHELAGGNAWVPQVLEGEYPNLDRADELDATTSWAEAMLQSAATVSITSQSSVSVGDQVSFEVRVTNHGGHKLPTGYQEGRRMWLDVSVLDGTGGTLWRSGGWNPATGVLAEDPQLKVYEIKPGIWDLNGTGICDTSDTLGRPIFHFVLNDCIALDNRIPPLGFTGMHDIETRPVNYTYPETAPGSGVLVNYDDTTYTVAVPASTAGDLTIEATLQYQTASDDYITFLRDQAVANGFPDDCIPRTTGLPGMSRGELLYDMWTRYDRAPPTAMATESTTVTVALFTDDFESGGTGAWGQTAP